MTLTVRNWSFWPLGTVEISTGIRYKYLPFGQNVYGGWNPDWGPSPIFMPSTQAELDALVASTPFTGYCVLKDINRQNYPNKPLLEWFGTTSPRVAPYWSKTEPQIPGEWEMPEWWTPFNFVPNDTSNTVTSSFRGLKYLEVVNSSNTPDWFDTQGVKVDGFLLTKKRPPIKRPKKPIYFQPRLKRQAVPKKPVPVELRINPPSPHEGEGVTSFEKRLERWTVAKKRREARLDRKNDDRYRSALLRYEVVQKANAARISKYDKAYFLAHAVYEKKLDDYLQAVKRSKDFSYSRSPAMRSGIPPDNPYGRIKMTLTAPAVYSRLVRFQRKWEKSYIDGKGDFTTYHYHDRYAIYETAALSSQSSNADLAQYGESVRTLVVSIINPYLEHFDNQLKRKIHQKLKKQTVHIGNIIAERKQTMDMVQSSVKRILDLIKLKKNIFKEAAKYAKNSKQIASDILAFKFGVEPLMNDIQSFAKYLDEDSDNHVVIARANSGKLKTIPLVVSTPSLIFEGFAEISYTVKCELNNPASRALSQFGLINPLEILWEVTPWSFVVDWFFPVGDWLSNKTSDCGLKFKTGTRKIKLVGNFTAIGLPQPGSTTGSSNSPADSSSVVSFTGEVVDRSVLTDLPNLPPISFKNPLSWSHGIETVALAVQRLKIRRP